MNCAEKREMVRRALLLYAVTDRSWVGEKTLYEQVKASLDGGITLLQLREKEMPYEDFLREAKDMKALAASYGVPLMINDNVDLALAVDADGVHVGQSDMEAGSVREKLGRDKIIGVSARTVLEALRAEKAGADYLGVGAVFSTSTKEDADVIAWETLKEICQSVSIPVVAIGGIKKDNVMQLAGSGAAGISVISGIYGQPDIRTTCEELLALAKEMIK
ncbi:thiamine phosphate synthase [Blautia marasmi]|uniref:thiamine phosphate synthase n=1 Tax=Blautia marasmi TaxID=1917868 RepID=UPI00351156A7